MSDKPLFQDPEFVQGQIEALRALVLALAQAMPKQTFRQIGLQRLEMIRTAIHAEPVAESRLIALEQAEQWLKLVTA